MLTNSSTFSSFSIRNAMPDFGSEVMAEALAQRALVKPVYTIPIIPLSNSNQYRHQDHLDMKDYKKVRPSTFTTRWLSSLIMSGAEWKMISILSGSWWVWVLEQNVCTSNRKCYWLLICPSLESIHTHDGWSEELFNAVYCISYWMLPQMKPWHFHCWEGI